MTSDERPAGLGEADPGAAWSSSADSGASSSLVANYLKQLAHIPLFTPAQEQAAARHLVELDLAAWRAMACQPRGLELLLEFFQGPPAIQRRVKALLRSAGRDRKQARRSKPPAAKGVRRQRALTELAARLRGEDPDQVLFETVLRELRADVWGRARGRPPASRLTIDRRGLLAIERAFGETLRARNDFMRANLRLVVSVARTFRHSHLALIDLIQEGNFGLLKAVHRFDYKRGFRFSTYAHWWIRQAIERAIVNKGNEVRLPVHVLEVRRQVARTAAMLFKEKGQEPTIDEIAAKLRLPIERLEQALTNVQPEPLSLDESLGDDDPRRLVELVRDDSRPSIDEAVIRESTYARLKALMSDLGDIEKDVISRRFGLRDGREQTLDEIGRTYDLSRERVRQIQAQAMHKMRRLCERRRIRPD